VSDRARERDRVGRERGRDRETVREEQIPR